MSKTVVLVHGAWLTPTAWGLFRPRFEARGFTTVAPAWPHMEIPIEELRTSPPAGIGSLTIREIVDHYERIIRALPEPPILVGHSFGGLIVQLLLDRGLGSAGVAMAPAPIKGVYPRLTALKSALPVFLEWSGWTRVLTMDFEHFSANFAQTLPDRAMGPSFDLYVVGAPGRIYWQSLIGADSRITPDSARRAPLLLIAGEVDRIVEPSMVRATYTIQQRAKTTTAYKSFHGRSHFMIAETGWQEIADYIIEWIAKYQR